MSKPRWKTVKRARWCPILKRFHNYEGEIATEMKITDKQLRAGAKAMYLFWYGERASEYDASPQFVKKNFEQMFQRGLRAALRAEARRGKR